MLSILIPAYNYNITKLVDDLHQQGVDSLVDFEIIVMEDGSTSFLEENSAVSSLSNCRYIVSEENLGRSVVRNKLADEAKYKQLLFIDCDAEVYLPHYVENYLAFRNEDCIVIGGTAYDPDEQNPAYSLRLKYGREREARLAKEREKQQYCNFATFNFMISKPIFNRVRFDESIRGYGHEDTLFGHQLHELGYEFIHIENSLIHKGLDDNETFLRKTEEAVCNLYRLYQTGNYPFLADESKLLHTYLRVKKMRMTGLLAFKFKVSRNMLRKNLLGKSPSLFWFDLYKLLYLCSVCKNDSF